MKNTIGIILLSLITFTVYAIGANKEVTSKNDIVFKTGPGLTERTRISVSGAMTITSLSASQAIVSNGSKQLISSPTTAAELEFLSGATSNVQTQLNAKQNTLPTFGNIAGTSNRLTVSGGTSTSVSGAGVTFDVSTSLLPSPSGGDTGKVLTATGANTAEWQTSASSSSAKVAIFKDVRSNGVGGGTASTGAWFTRSVNTFEGDTSFASRDGSNIILQAGTYVIHGTMPFRATDASRSRLYDLTNSTVIAQGSNVNASSNTGDVSHIMTTTTVSASTTYQLQYKAGLSTNDNDLGLVGPGADQEVYVQIQFLRLY